MEARIKMAGLNKPKRLSNIEKGRARLMRIQEAEENGELQKAKNRLDVMRLAGFISGQETQGRLWIQRLINQRKTLTETLTGFGANGKAEYEYHLVGYAEKKSGRPKREDVIPTKIKPAMKLTLTTTNGKLEIEHADMSTFSTILDFLK